MLIGDRVGVVNIKGRYSHDGQILDYCYQLLLPIPDLDAQDRHVARVMFEMMLDRAYHDLRLAPHKADALAWFEGGECRAWCQLLGLDMTPLLARVEVEIDKPLRWVHKKAQA